MDPLSTSNDEETTKINANSTNSKYFTTSTESLSHRSLLDNIMENKEMDHDEISPSNSLSLEKTDTAPTNSSHFVFKDQDNDTVVSSPEMFSPASSTLATITNHQNRSRSTLVGSNKNVAPAGKTSFMWEDFVRKGTKLKNYWDDALQRIGQPETRELSTTATTRSTIHDNNNTDGNKKRSRDNIEKENTNMDRFETIGSHHAAKLAQQKTMQVVQLQRDLQSLQAQVSSLNATNMSLREEVTANYQQWQRTAKSLQTAGSRAAQARADADAAEATALNLVQTLKALQDVITETKEASQILHQEHETLQKATNAVQSQLVMKETDLVRTQREMANLRSTNEQLELAKKNWQTEKDNITRNTKQQEEEIQQLRRTLEEREIIEQARANRAEEIEKSYRQSQILLKEATAGQEKAQETQNLLQDTIDKLQQANQELHRQAEEDRAVACQDKQRLNKALTKAEKDVQQLRIQKEALDEELQRIKLDKKATDKQLTELQNKITSLERKSHDHNTVPSIGNLTSPNAMGDVSSSTSSGIGFNFSIPPLNSVTPITNKNVGKSNDLSPMAAPHTSCCLCLKASIGLMKKCQCEQVGCDKQAHAVCANKLLASMPGPSVSHPCTPAPRLPLVFCSSLANVLSKNNSS